MASDYEAIFKALPNSARMKLKSLISSFKEAGGKGLEEFTASIKNDPDKQSNLPKDGTVHELTSNTIIFMEHLMEYSEIAGDMLNYQTTDSAAPLSQELGHGQCKTILGSYIARVLGALGLNLERKAKCYENVALQSIFLMNNYHHIIKSLERSGLIEWINALDGEITLEEHYKALIANQQHSYQKCWNKIIQNLIEENKSYHSGSDDSKMSRGSRQIIKDRFKAFNTGFEEVQRIQQHYSIPDEQLRNNIRKENIDTVVPLYEAFLQKHGNSQFTKNRDKYVKYSVQDLVNALSTFFDVSA
ncbi:uncharacterized protein TRIADDRAFT_53055 [Trichoplax adhaerens]|uniref:Exocyst complex component 7 n=1 Tax=Trichoplax adhaerens TaxID=10228 RepID=B3RN65_TRIAD|nr:hypothetical protein TRIADDRAFT_53055 [Trichoplax adhaerens]EDV27966.1 hypothetical protein TRIADDRAFT_53055 [Trichoplax adhaerens]|eukprot:XP_002109800.1 hypothetical protein TRIADDRAFT_53055 [Trichoplax adhaerens]